MATPRVLLILGAGPRIGSAVASKFASLGYSIALASRKGTNTTTPESYLSLRADFTSTACMPALFAAVKSTFHTAPSVIVYNAGSLHTPPDARSVLSIPVEDVVTDLIVNTVSVYAAAQEAIRGWETLGADAKKSFIYTGNILNVAIMPVPMLLDVGMGKAASAYWLGVADGAYKDRGARFFYADERTEDGKLKGMALDAGAHADFYAGLAEHVGDVPWHATFTKGKGYVHFE